MLLELLQLLMQPGKGKGVLGQGCDLDLCAFAGCGLVQTGLEPSGYLLVAVQ
jgi:hypothetical protein